MAGRRSLLQQLDHLRVAAPLRVFQRRHAVTVRNAKARPGVDQPLDDLDMARAAVAEDDGLEQSGPAEVVDMINIDPGVDQHRNGLDMPALRCWNERSA